MVLIVEVTGRTSVQLSGDQLVPCGLFLGLPAESSNIN